MLENKLCGRMQYEFDVSCYEDMMVLLSLHTVNSSLEVLVN
jgi:hypothetical protein